MFDSLECPVPPGVSVDQLNQHGLYYAPITGVSQVFFYFRLSCRAISQRRAAAERLAAEATVALATNRQNVDRAVAACVGKMQLARRAGSDRCRQQKGP